MARAIPTYEQQRPIAGIQNVATATSSVNATDPAAAGLSNLGTAMGNLSGVLQAEEKKKQEDRASVDVANVLSQGDVYWQENMAERMKNWKVGDADLREGIGKDFDKWVGESAPKLQTEASRKYFLQHAARTKATLQQNAYTFQDKSTTEKLNADTLVGIEADEAVVYGNSAKRDEVYARRMETVLARNDLSEAEKIRQGSALKSKLNLAAERGEMERDPTGWYIRRFGGLPEAVGGTKPAAPATGSKAIADAIYGQESSSGKADTSKVNSQNVTGPMQVQEGTFKGMKDKGIIPKDYDWRNPEHNKAAGYAWVDYLSQKYNGDPEKVAAAYYGGEGAVAEDGTIKRHWRNKQRPNDPTVGQYVDQVVGRMKKDGGGGAPAGDAPKTYAGLGIDQQRQMKAMAEQKISQDNTRLMANAAIEVAEIAVTSQAIGTSGTIDLNMASAQAIDEAKARKGSDLTAVERQQVEAQVSHAAARRERDRKIAQDNAAGSMFDLLDRNGGDYQDLQRSMAGEMSNLPRETLDRLQKYAGEVATGGTRVTDWKAYAQLVENPEALANVNLKALRDKFSRDEYNQLAGLQARVLKAKEEGQPQTIQSDMAVVKDLLQASKVKPNSEREAKFFAQLQGVMEAEMAASGKKKLTQKEVKELAADLLVKEVTSKGLLWDTTKPAFEIEVPANEKTKIIAALQSQGMPVNESAILRVYRNKLQRNNSQQPATVQ